jgi:hypothetical protein
VFVDHSMRPEDIPEPPTPGGVARDFPVPLLTLVEQPRIEEFGVSTMSDGQGQSATLTYTFWRNPDDHADPANLSDPPIELGEPVGPLPDWILRARDRMRFPMLWEVVRTTHTRERTQPWQTPERMLVDHANYILMNTFREERMRGDFPGELDGRMSEAAIERGIPVSLDGADVPGLRIDTDPHVFALGADLGDSILTAVLPRDYLGLVDFTFRTRP